MDDMKDTHQFELAATTADADGVAAVALRVTLAQSEGELAAPVLLPAGPVPVPRAVPDAPVVAVGEATFANPVDADGAQLEPRQGQGDDVLFGDEGDDVLRGGPGNDSLHGGRIADGPWVVVIDAQDRLYLRHHGSPVVPAVLNNAQPGSSATQMLPDEPVSEARLLLHAASADRVKEIALLYHAVVGVWPELGWLHATANSVASSESLVQLAADHWLERTPVPEALSDRVRGLMEQVWGTVSEADVQEGVSYLQHGGNWAQGLALLVAHPRASANWRSPGGELVLTQPLKAEQANGLGASGDDILYGGLGDDELAGGDGRNLLDGGEGTDLVTLFGALDDCTVQLMSTVPGVADVLLVDHANGSENLLRNIEWLRLGDGVYRAKANAPALSQVPLPLADCVELVPAQTLTLMGLPMQA